MTPLRVLLVDDHDHVRFGLRRLLEGQGHAVEEAEDGLEGVRKALSWGPDVAVVDLDMPVLDGYGVARRVRRTLGQGIHLIALTGLDDRQAAFAAGFDSYVRKPADPGRLCSLVQEAAPRVTRRAG
jgi:CheY-like chemotaxis protein